MKHLRSLNKYFWKYRYRFFFGIFFIILSNYFAILAPQVTAVIFDMLQENLGEPVKSRLVPYDPLVNVFIHWMNAYQLSFTGRVATFSIAILAFALLSG